MAILNYTTKIETEKTFLEIQKKLVKAGAQALLSEFDSDGVMIAVSFSLQTPHGLIYYKLPANFDGVLKTIQRDSNIQKRFKTPEQAARVAWRIIKDWVEAQLAIVEAELAELPEVFLPYAQTNNGETVYKRMNSENFKLLTSHP